MGGSRKGKTEQEKRFIECFRILKEKEIEIII